MNAIEHRERKSDAVMAAVGSAFIHLLIALCIAWLSTVAVMMVKTPEAEKEESVILLSPDYFEIEPPAIPPVEVAQNERRYQDANPLAPELAPVDPTNLIGSRDSQAASESPRNEGTPDLPSQLSNKEPDDRSPQFTDSSFSEGQSQTSAPPTPQQKSQAQASEQPTEAIDEPVREQPVAPPTQSAQTASTASTATEVQETAEAVEKVEYLESANSLEVQAPLIEEKSEPVEEAQVATAPAIDEVPAEKTATLPKPPETTTTSDPAFSSEKRKSRLIGSLSRQGVSALDVKSTALGKYYNKVSQIIEIEWRRNCVDYREHIQPGAISMQFYIAKDGKITNPRPFDVVGASNIQKAFTIKAIRKSKLPPIPPEVQEELKGEQLELIYNFYF